MSSFGSACLPEFEVCRGHFLKLLVGRGGGGGGGGGGACFTISSFRPTSIPEPEVFCFLLNLLTGGGGWGGGGGGGGIGGFAFRNVLPWFYCSP